MRMVLSVMLLLLVPTAMVHGQTTGLTQSFAASLTAVPTDPQTVAGSVYVPAYSSVAMTPGKMRADFSVTLSLHNASESAPVILKRIAYFDTSGMLVQSYLQEPIALRPFATIEIFIPTKDVRGGTGANFVIDWAATAPIAEPVAEALMIGSLGSGHYAVISQGRAVRVVGSKPREP